VERGLSIGNITTVDDGGDIIGLNLGGEGFRFSVDFSGFREGGDETVEGGVVAI